MPTRRVGKIAHDLSATCPCRASDFAHPTQDLSHSLAKSIARIHIPTHKRVSLADFIFVKRPHTKPPFPSKEDLLAFIGKAPGKIGTREIARAFGLKNADRAALKRVLQELAQNGLVERRRKKLHHPGTLPHVVLADITGRDSDGELIALPTEWDEAERGAAPRIRGRIPRRARPREGAGAGGGLRGAEGGGGGGEPIRHPGRVIKLIERSRQRVLGIFRAAPGGGGRLAPIDKKELGRELSIPPGGAAGARDGDLVAVEVAARQSGYGLHSARVTERLGSLATERAVSPVAIHPHFTPHRFPPAAIPGSGTAQ